MRSSYEQVGWETIFDTILWQMSTKMYDWHTILPRINTSFYDYIFWVFKYKVINKQINDCIFAYNTYLEICFNFKHEMNNAIRLIFIKITKDIWKHVQVEVNLWGKITNKIQVVIMLAIVSKIVFIIWWRTFINVFYKRTKRSWYCFSSLI